jgi:hypothetical protein
LVCNCFLPNEIFYIKFFSTNLFGPHPTTVYTQQGVGCRIPILYIKYSLRIENKLIERDEYKEWWSMQLNIYSFNVFKYVWTYIAITTVMGARRGGKTGHLHFYFSVWGLYLISYNSNTFCSLQGINFF